MRIVHAIRSDGFAGVERHVARLAEAQAERGHQLVVIGGDPASMRAAIAHPAVRLVPARTTVQVARALRPLLRGADVVHVHMTAAELAAALAFAATGRAFRRRRTRPALVTTRHFGAPRGRGLAGRLVAAIARTNLDAQIAISHYVAEHVDGVATVVHPGVDDRPDGRAAAERERVVLMVQRLQPEKRTDVGLRAFAASGLAAEGWRLQIAGDGALRPDLERLATDLAISDQVDFLGMRSDVEDLMGRASLLLASCPTEGLGLSVLEAMASGLPVVASAAAGHLETLDGLDHLALYPATEHEEAGRHLRALALDEARRQSYGIAAREAQRTRFSLAAQADGTGAVYAEALAGLGAASGPSARARGGRGAAPAPSDLVVLSLEPWDEVWRRNQYLVAGLMEADPSARVLFVEPAADPLYAMSRRSRPRLGLGLRQARPGSGVDAARLWLYQPTKALPRRLDPRADARLSRGVLRAARRVRMDRPVLWINDPSAANLLEVSGWPALYDITDDWLAAHRTPAEHARLVADEAALFAGCAEVTVCSTTLVRTKGAQRPVTLITNGVDVERYRRPHPRPADLPAVPVALYLGTIHTDRFDLDLCAQTAREVGARGAVVLVGPAPLEGPDLQRLEDAGVLVLGPRPYRDVPAYLQHAHVLVVPHIVDDFTDSLDPIKLYEYRAVRRPVVSTPVSGFRDVDDPLVTVATGADFAAAVVRSLAAADAWDPRAEVPAEIPRWSDQAAAMARVIERVRRHAATPG